MRVEEQIAQWRDDFDGLREEDIDELESHLRDELDALEEVGMTGPEAITHAIGARKVDELYAVLAEIAAVLTPPR